MSFLTAIMRSALGLGVSRVVIRHTGPRGPSIAVRTRASQPADLKPVEGFSIVDKDRKMALLVSPNDPNFSRHFARFG